MEAVLVCALIVLEMKPIYISVTVSKFNLCFYNSWIEIHLHLCY